MFIKVCGITNLEDARAAIDSGADALGFNFYPLSSRYITPEDARRINDELPSGVMKVGVFVNESAPEEVDRISDAANLTAVQLHGDESPEYCYALRDRFVIKAFGASEDFKPETVKEYETDAILLDAYDRSARGGTGRVVDWEVARSVRALVPRLFLAGGLSPENVSEAIVAVDPYAVDACSRLESAPGKKNVERVRAFIAAVRRSAR